jgi:acetyl-CoA hydrolase
MVFGIGGGRQFSGHQCRGTSVIRFGSFGHTTASSESTVIERIRYSDVPAFLRELQDRVITLVQVSPMGPLGHSLSLTAEYLPAAVDLSYAVLAEVNQLAVATRTDCPVRPDQITGAIETASPLRHTEAPPSASESQSLARHLGELIPHGSTIQLGLGRVVENAARGLTSHTGLAVHSGIIGDAVLRLEEAGAIRTRGGRPDVRTTMIQGSRRLYTWAGESGVLLSRVEVTHDSARLACDDRFFSINSALQVSLQAEVNSEVAGGKYVGAVGGLVDFSRAADASKHGLSIVVLPSTAKGGKESRIIAASPVITTLPAESVGAVVTEFGSARLVGLDTRERAMALASIAHPDFRAELMDAAKASS